MGAADNKDEAMPLSNQPRDHAPRESSAEGQRQDSTKDARGRLTQVFRYLQALNELRNPVCEDIRSQHWVMWLDEVPTHPCIQLGTRRVELAEDAEANEANADDERGSAGTISDGYILKVKRPILTQCPEPPRELIRWLLEGWQLPDGDARVASQLENPSLGQITNSSTTTHIEEFAADPTRQEVLDEWSARREAWIQQERPARLAMVVFERLYAIHAQIERESERIELMLGDGLLRWDVAGSRINHPMLLTRLQLTFDPQIPEFTLIETEQPPELYSAPLRRVPNLNSASIKRSRADVNAGNWHPLGGEETSRFFRRFVSQLSAKGELVDAKNLPRQADAPCMYRRPVVFVRSRTLGFGAALEAILENLPHTNELPQSLLSIVGVSPTPRQNVREIRTLSLLDSVNGDDENILLSKPANAEQLEIVHKLERDGAVLVQGPPGTGKTHTIANMIGHLLAQGKTVLVTSHTAKALTVLREQVVKPLQPLCVSVLDDSRTQVAAAVDAITERLAASDVDSLEREAAGLRRERAALLGRLRNARAKLLEARQDEYRPIVIAGDEIHPSQAARRVADARASASWIPAPVTMGEPLPLSPGEVAELYRTNAEVSAADEVQLTKKLPAPDDLVTPGTFARCVSERAELEVADQSDPLSKLWRGEPTAQDEDSLRLLRQRLEQASEPLRAGEKWQLAAIAAGHTGGGHRQAWEDLIAEIESTYKAAAEAQPLILSALPAMAPGYDLDRAVRILEDIATYVAAGGKLNWLKLATKPDWRTITDTAQVRGTHPERLDDFRALLALARREKARQTLVGRWHYQMSALGAPPVEALGAEPEEICRQFVSPLRTCLAWYQDQWEPLQRELVARGLKWETVLAEVPPQLDTYGELLRLREAALTRLPPIVAARIRQVRLVQIDEQLNQLRASLMRFGSGANAAEVVVSLRAAVNAYNAVEYQDAFERLVDLHTRTKALETRRTLLGRLERTAPAWAAAVRGRLGIHGQSAPPGDVAEAWEWRQLHDELDQRSKTSLETLQNSIADLTAELHETTAKLVEKTAWAAQVRRTTLEQRQALQGWKQLIRKAGRGTGIRAPRLLAEARALMPVCQTAVPVWIMPLSRVVDNFDVGRNRFDVVIIDEASQADTMALIAVYMARQVVVVGDDEQVSPLAVGQKQAEVQRIIDEHLVGVPQHQLYDGQYSIYELGQTSFEPVCLLEHFRCVMPIIQFSNYLSYGGKIKPLRDASMVRRVPHTVAYRVRQAGATTGNVNEVEAVTIASLLVAATEQPEYAGASFGVISLVGDEQAMRVDSLLRNHLPPVEYQGRRIQCGNSAQFQGDERDVIFLSMVDTSVDGAPLALRTEGPFNLYKKRFNVAASRARDQMWVVYSLDPETHLKPGDLRRRLIQHAQDPMAASLTLERQEQRTESEFERLVLRRLVAAGYNVVPQWSVGAYRIDMVVEGGGKRLAVECDGDRWHPHSKLEEDMARQAILERLGWRFVRIRGSQFFQDADAAMKPVFARLQELEVTPDGNVGSSDVDTVGHDLRERVIRRASELRAEWETPSDAWLALDSDEDHSNFSEDNLGSAVQVGPGAANGPSSLAQTASAITSEPRVSTSPSRSDVSSRATSDQRSTSDEARSNLPTTIPGENRPEASRSPQKSTPNRSQSVAANIARAEQVVNRTNREQTAPTSMSLSDAIGFLRSRGLQLIDNRAKGGALWVIGGPALSVVFDELKQRGVRFAFARAGNKATGHRPAWFLETGRQ